MSPNRSASKGNAAVTSVVTMHRSYDGKQQCEVGGRQLGVERRQLRSNARW